MTLRIFPASPTSPGSSAPDDALERRRNRVRSTQLEHVLQRPNRPLAFSAALAMALWIACGWRSRDPLVLLWGLFVHATQAGQWALARDFRARGRDALMNADAWLRRHLAWVAASSLAWGLSGPMLMPADAGLVTTATWAAILFAAAAAVAPTVAVVRAASAWWLLPMLGMLIGWLLLHPTPVHLAMAPLAATYLAAIWYFSHTQHRLLRTSLQTRLDNDTLVRELRHQVVLVERADREKSRFLASASHDLRQPMHALGLFASTLDRQLSGTALQPTVANMMRSIESLEQSFTAMLDISKLDAGVIEPNLQSFPIRELFKLLHMHCAGQAEELGLSLRFRPGGKVVTSDPQLLQRVLSNLVLNAIRYTRQGGVVVVVRQRRGLTSIEVWDTGVGIAEDELPRVFDEFYQIANPGRDRSRGLGMGLAIVKRLVLLMGHSLEVSSRPGHGTVFRVLLRPTELADLDNVVLGADTVPSPIDTGQTLLLIDDEESIRTGMREFLQTWGYQVLTAGTILEACTEVRRHAGVIDLVMSDMRLSNREDGIDAIDRVREAYGAPLPALLLTGDTSPEQVKRAHESGHRVLFKPVRPRDLHDALRSLP